MRVYRYAKKQYIKLNASEVDDLRNELIKASAQGAWGFMRSPINGMDLDIKKLNFNCCIGCSWLQVLINYTNNEHGAKWGYNTYLKNVVNI